MKKQLYILTALITITASSAIAQTTLISEFDFNGNLNDNLGNSTCISHNNLTTSYTSGTFNWTAVDTSGNGGGLQITLPDTLFTEDNYSVFMRFQFSETSSYNKIIDYSNLSFDQGLYVNGSLRLYSSGNYGPVTIPADSTIQILLTRDSITDSTIVYLWDGINLSAQSVSYDQNGDFIASLSGNERMLYLFADDSLTLTEYTSTGSVDQIRIWNGVVGIDEFLGIQEAFSQAISISPNPANEKVTIRFEENVDGEAGIYSLQGECLMKQQLNQQHEITFAVQEIPQGIYVIRLNDSCYRLVKQ
jgi:hypothetical protein